MSSAGSPDGGGASVPPSIESLANNAIAAGCLQAVMNLVHPELTKYVDFQRERVARLDAEAEAEAERRGQCDAPGPNGRLSRRGRRVRDPSDDDNNGLHPDQQTDLSTQLKFLREHWHSHLRFHGGDPQLPVLVQRSLMYRNKVSHQSQMTLAQYENAIATFERLAEVIECNVLIRQQIRALVAQLLSFSPSTQKEKQPTPESAMAQTSAMFAAMQADSGPEAVEASEEVDYVPYPPAATVEQLQQHNYYHDVDDEPLWLDLKAIGNEYFKEGIFGEAIEAYSQALELAPHEAVLYGNRATCHLRLREFDLAREDAEEAMDEDGGENVKYYRLLSEALMGLEEYDQAKEICDEGLEQDPTDVILQTRQRNADAMCKRLLERAEEEKKQREQEEKAKREAAAEALKSAETRSKVSGKSKRKSNKHKSRGNETEPLELAAMISYKDLPAKLVEVHMRGSRQLETYREGLECLVVAARSLLAIPDSVGKPSHSQPPLKQLLEDGLANLLKAGKAGVPEAWFRLGVLYSSPRKEGIPLAADPKKQMEYFQKAAECRPFVKPPGSRIFAHQGVGEAEFQLGVCYRDGNPPSEVSVDLEKAFRFFLRSAEHDFPMGQYNVAIAYSKGEGTAVDAFAARMWTSRAAQHGLPEAQQYLAQLFETGFGGKIDMEQARQWSVTAVQNRMGNMVRGHGFAEVSSVAVNGGEVAKRFGNGVKRAKEELARYYNAYLEEDENEAQETASGLDDVSESTSTETLSTTVEEEDAPEYHSSVMYRASSAVVDAEIARRAEAGGPTASSYLASQELLDRATSAFQSGNTKDGLRDVKKADLLWERTKHDFPAPPRGSPDLLSMTLRGAAARLQENPKDMDALYAIGRWKVKGSEEMIRHWKRCVKLHPQEACFRFFLGTRYLLAHRFEDAATAFEAALDIEKKPHWLFHLASPLIGMGIADGAMAIYEEYVAQCPPDERHVADAYFSLGALHLRKRNNTMAVVCHELGQLADSAAIRFPAFHVVTFGEASRDSFRRIMRTHGLMEPSVVANAMGSTSVKCSFCDCTTKPTQLLNHKMTKCPRRTVVCQVCGASMVFDALQAHRASHNSQNRANKKASSKKPKASTASASPECKDDTKLEDGRGLFSPKFHLFGGIVEISKGKNSKPTVIKLQDMSGRRWAIRVTMSVVLNSSSVHEAAVEDTLMLFWRNSPPLDMIEKHVLAIPSGNEVFDQDVAVHVIKTNAQAVLVETFQLACKAQLGDYDTCSNCRCSPHPASGGGMASCGACKKTQYCSRQCQKIHWKRIHRLMCGRPMLLAHCISGSEDIAPELYSSQISGSLSHPQYDSRARKAVFVHAKTNQKQESTLGILQDILQTVESSSGDAKKSRGTIEHYILPPVDSGIMSPNNVSVSARIFRWSTTPESSSTELVAEFLVGYLTSVATVEQQDELVYFFQMPPHNPLQLKFRGLTVHLAKCQGFLDDPSGSGFRLGMQLPLASFPIEALAELLDYLLTNTSIYLS